MVLERLLKEKTPSEIAEGEDAYPIYVYKEGQQILAYAFPIIGKGLWSTLYGYLALEPDAKNRKRNYIL